jgi:hypothetical protein
MPVPDFSPGEVLTAAAMDSIGLWLVKTQTIGTGVPSVTVTDAFSSTYDNYLITVSGGTGSANSEMNLRFGAAVTGYRWSFLFTFYTSTVGALGSSSAASINYVGAATPSSLSAYITVQNPFLSEQTFVQGTSSPESFSGNATGQLTNTTSYTDFSLVLGVGTMTGGTIRVYGYRK